MKYFKYLLLIAAMMFFAGYSVAGSDDESKVRAEENTGEVVILNKDDFLKKVYDYKKNTDKWVYEDTIPCIIDFYADWCGPCKMVDPILKELAKEYKGKVRIYKINTDNEREIAIAFGVRSIPSYLFIPAKGNPQSAVGAQPREVFVRVIEEFLLK